jgi:hypothetical protein
VGAASLVLVHELIEHGDQVASTQHSVKAFPADCHEYRSVTALTRGARSGARLTLMP